MLTDDSSVDGKTRLVGCDVDLRDVEELDRLEPNSWPTGNGRLSAPNGAATMKYTGDFDIFPTRRTYREDEGVMLKITNEDINGEIEFEPLEAFRLGLALMTHGEAEYDV